VPGIGSWVTCGFFGGRVRRAVGGGGKRRGSVTGVTGCGCNRGGDSGYFGGVLSVYFMPEVDIADIRYINELHIESIHYLFYNFWFFVDTSYLKT